LSAQVTLPPCLALSPATNVLQLTTHQLRRKEAAALFFLLSRIAAPGKASALVTR
jgi:hypothetical protein